jgi:hypothetical protein
MSYPVRSNLGNRRAVGVASAQNRIVTNGWVVTFRPADMPLDADYEVWHGSATGPGGYFQVYIDDVLFDVGENGKINAYEPSIPMYVRKGQTISLHWSVTTGTAPVVVLFLRQPEVGRGL